MRKSDTPASPAKPAPTKVLSQDRFKVGDKLRAFLDEPPAKPKQIELPAGGTPETRQDHHQRPQRHEDPRSSPADALRDH